VSFSSRLTARVASGQTIVASELEQQGEAQLLLVSARLHDTSSPSQASAPVDGANEAQVRIFTLQNAPVDGAASVILQLFADGSGNVKVSPDPRTNSLIVAAPKETLDIIEAVLLRLDENDSKPVSQQPESETNSTSTPPATKYDKLDKNALQAELKRLVQELQAAERTALLARENATEAVAAYSSAPEESKPDALVRMIEADAASRKPMEGVKQIQSDLDAARQAYLRLLTAE
jgi:hypothetical protein